MFDICHSLLFPYLVDTSPMYMLIIKLCPKDRRAKEEKIQHLSVGCVIYGAQPHWSFWDGV